ncbi:hypothetical protein [Thioalkalivibrio sp. XN279]|uniref:hypothetical protein n=1 Tax=Thioalkalivibrio sp. XN279 TaxID=2714953 RepID=UPI00140E5F29|nr:hypothetical protein [Thioalkalivibrio sp. XN279]NHA14136.1 hypothetical protein [Thioalkalivibrio sp. XN279]
MPGYFAEIVEHRTDDMIAPGEAKPPWVERKQAYLAMLEHKDNYRAILTDLRTFVREGQPQEEFWRRFVDDKPGTDLQQRVPEILWYYQSLANVISRKA